MDLSVLTAVFTATDAAISVLVSLAVGGFLMALGREGVDRLVLMVAGPLAAGGLGGAIGYFVTQSNGWPPALASAVAMLLFIAKSPSDTKAARAKREG